MNFFGSWKFILWQTFIVMIWMFLNSWHGWPYMWDSYPFILLNLAFSTQAAYAAPLVMIGQRRNAQVQKERDEHDHNLLIEMSQNILDLVSRQRDAA